MRGLKVVQAIGATIAAAMMAACSPDAYLPAGPLVPEGVKVLPRCQLEYVRNNGVAAERQLPRCDSLPAAPVTGGDR